VVALSSTIHLESYRYRRLKHFPEQACPDLIPLAPR
jgi:hypothetical protein